MQTPKPTDMSSPPMPLSNVRLDVAHAAVVPPASLTQPIASPAARPSSLSGPIRSTPWPHGGGADEIGLEAPTAEAIASDERLWLESTTTFASAHLETLCHDLQRWANDLDQREAQLNAQEALLDQRQRQFRLWQASQRAATEDQLGQAQLQLDALARRARELAIEQWASAPTGRR
jgi:hypothetical protein